MTCVATCPHHDFSATFDPLDLSDPFPLLAGARREQPVFYNPDIDYWVITRYNDIKAIFRDHETYTAANTITPIVPFSQAVQRMLAQGDYSPEPVLSNNVPAQPHPHPRPGQPPLHAEADEEFRARHPRHSRARPAAHRR